MSRFIRKADIILIILVIAAGIAATVMLPGAEASGGSVYVTIDGSEYGTYPLSEDRDIDLGTGNVIRIKDGKVRMISATCHGHDCMKQGSISRAPESIICLPHKVVVEIKGKEKGYDTVAK